MRVTHALIAANALIYAWMLVATRPPDFEFSTETLVAYGGLWTPALRAGEWWRLVTATFLHANLSHVAWNMLSLYILGRYLEGRYAAARYAVLYFVCGILSSAATAWWLWQSDIVAIGASGAVCGLIGAGAVSAWRMGARGTEFRNSMVAWGAVVLINGFTYQANNVAHAAGIAVGALLVYLFGRRGAAALAPRAAGAEALGANVVVCGACGAANPTGSRFCGSCGRTLGASVTP